jgi:membrane protease YdiL (CAAX protease family)
MKCGLLRAASIGTSGMPRRLPLLAAGAVVMLSALALALSGHLLTRLIMLLVLAPLLEETVFRAGLQDALLRRWYSVPFLANAVTAVAFGLAHAVVRADVAAFAVAVPALLIGAIYQRTGRLRECIVLHASMNAVWLGWSLTGVGLFGSR